MLKDVSSNIHGDLTEQNAPTFFMMHDVYEWSPEDLLEAAAEWYEALVRRRVYSGHPYPPPPIYCPTIVRCHSLECPNLTFVGHFRQRMGSNHFVEAHVERKIICTI